MSMKNSKFKKVLVTGGGGFIGSHTVNKLLKKGCEVIVLDNFTAGLKRILNLKDPNLEIVYGDVTEFKDVLEQINRCEIVLHLAALPNIKKTIEDPISSLKTNTLGFINVLQAIRLLKKDIRLVYASSAAVYGDVSSFGCDDYIELDATNLLSPYALEKANNEFYAHLYKELYGIHSLGLRYFNVYGQGQNPQSGYSGVISRFIHQIENEGSITIYGDGQQSRDFIHVSDVSSANVLACFNDYSGVINIGTGISTKINTLSEHIISASGRKINIKYEPSEPGNIQNSFAKIEKAGNAIGFFAKSNLQKSISSLVNHQRS